MTVEERLDRQLRHISKLTRITDRQQAQIEALTDTVARLIHYAAMHDAELAGDAGSNAAADLNMEFSPLRDCGAKVCKCCSCRRVPRACGGAAKSTCGAQG